MEWVKGKNGRFQFSSKSYSPSDVTADHCFLIHFIWFTNWSSQTFYKKWVEYNRHELLDYYVIVF